MRIKELDSLRGIAAISVVLAHITLSLPMEKNIFRLGVSGVDLFFLISGYVIYMTIEKMSNPVDFIIARIGRLYPAYWFVVVYTFLLFFCWCSLTRMPQKYSFIDLLGNLTMFQRYFSAKEIIAPAWTLLIEMLFYILIVLLFIYKLIKHVEKVIVAGIVVTFC